MVTIMSENFAPMRTGTYPRKATMTRILIVEDEESYREPLVYQLTREGYDVSAAATGEEGLELFTKGGIDLVLLDLMLPGCQFAADQIVSPAWQLEAERLLNQEGADIEEEIENDRKFHYLLVEASHNNLFFELMNAITDVYREWIDFVIRYASPEVKGALKKAHQEMFEAILTHDRQRCEAAIDRHYDIIERRIQEG